MRFNSSNVVGPEADIWSSEMPRSHFPTLFCGPGADAREIRELQRLATAVYFRSGATIFAEGEPAASVFGLAQGVVRLYKLLPDGRRQILAFALPGDFLGMPLAERHNFSADAIGEVALCRFSHDELTAFIQSSPNVMRRLIEFAILQLDMAQDQLLLLGNGSAEEKVAIFLVSWRNRLARLSVFSETVPLPMRRQDIADFLGLKLETVSRTLAKLEQKNVIRLVPKGVFLTGLEQTLLVKGRSFQPQI
jgi:CRP/FNR family transcriptional regulator, anaerobic regulatory protein